MDLGGTPPRIFFFQAVDFFDCRIRQCAGDAFVGTGFWQERIETAFFVVPFMIREAENRVDSQAVVRRGKVCRTKMGSLTVRGIFV